MTSVNGLDPQLPAFLGYLYKLCNLCSVISTAIEDLGVNRPAGVPRLFVAHPVAVTIFQIVTWKAELLLTDCALKARAPGAPNYIGRKFCCHWSAYCNPCSAEC